MALYDLMLGKVKDDSGRLDDISDYFPAIDAALAVYSKHKPKEAAKDLAGDGTHDLALPDDWVEDFSGIRRVEYPIGEVPETFIADGDWMLYRSPDGLKLRLVLETPDADETVRVTYTVMRLEGDIPAVDLDAVACLAASVCLENQASLMGHNSDSTIPADSVDHKSQADKFAARARRFSALYYQHMGIDPKASAAAAMTIAPAPASDQPRLTHGRR